MKRSWTVFVLAALAIVGGMAAGADEANPPLAPVPVPPPERGKIEPVIVSIHHAKASHVADYLQAAIDFSDHRGVDVVLKGTAKALADDRANVIILLTAKENMPFFGRMIQALDVVADEPPAPAAPPGQPPAQPQAGAAEKKDAPRP